MSVAASMPVFDTLLKCLDLLLKALTAQHALRREDFVTFYEPIFQDLEKVHVDYVSMFSTLNQKVGEGTDGLREAGAELAQLRLSYAPVRQRLRATARAMAEARKGKEPERFLRAVCA